MGAGDDRRVRNMIKSKQGLREVFGRRGHGPTSLSLSPSSCYMSSSVSVFNGQVHW